MNITVGRAIDIHVASRLAEQVRPLNALLTEAYGKRTEVTSLEFESAVAEDCYYWELNLEMQCWVRGRFESEQSCTIHPDDDSAIAVYLKAVLSWMYTPDRVEYGLGQEFGMNQPYLRIDHI